MPRKELSTLGIDLNELEIRVIQVRTRGSQPFIEKVGRAAMPAGAIECGVVTRPGLVSEALRSLLNSMEVSSHRVAIGVSGDAVSQRTITVPPAPDEDLASIVRGEVEDHQLVKTAFGAYAYIRLSSECQPAMSHTWTQDNEIWIDSRTSKFKQDLVTVFAIEQETISAIRDAIEGAGLTVEIIEPTQYAMYRSIQLATGLNGTFFGVMVGPSNTDIAVVCKGQLVAYRRIDTGSRAITGDYAPTSEYSYAGIRMSAYADEPHEVVNPDSRLNSLSLEEFSTEVHRTIYYYQREYPDLSQCEQVVLAVDDSRLENLASELSSRLGLTVERARPFGTSLDNPVDQSPFASRAEVVCSAAYGLAMDGIQISKVPRIDLFTEERNAVQNVESKRNFKGSIIVSLLAAAIGIAGVSLYSGQIAQLQSEVKQISTEATQIRSQIDLAVQSRQQQADQYKAFRKRGLPITQILDSIADSVGPGAGLTSVNVSPDRTVVITGEADTETSMLSMMNALNSCPLLQNVKIDWFKQMPQEKAPGITFEFRGTTVTSAQVIMPGEQAQ
ncbi:MAG: pilus assembly protein PilM [Fimbriimonas sp.]|nr:pilus assembly protein PilM [Fimbriimonas sp.]